jgi:DNA adenine methylase
MKTFLKYQGNKTRLLKYIIPMVPESFDRYIEPFVGSGALFLDIHPERWIINDLNNDIYTLWLTIKNNLKTLLLNMNKIEKNLYKTDNKLEYMRRLCKSIYTMQFDEKRSSNFLVSKNLAYMGLLPIKDNGYYFNGFELNFDRKEKHKIFSDSYYRNISNISMFMNNTNGKMYNKDYKKIISLARSGDFVFLDPPYIESHDYRFNYNSNENYLNDNFLKELLYQVKKLDNKNVKWLMTQANTQDVRNIFKGYNTTKVSVYRGIKNSYTTELIIRNYQ